MLGLHPVIHVPHYSFTDPRDGWLSWPCWLTDSRQLNRKVVVTHPASSLAEDRESSPAETSVLTNMLRRPRSFGPKNIKTRGKDRSEICAKFGGPIFITKQFLDASINENNLQFMYFCFYYINTNILIHTMWRVNSQINRNI